jgi:tripartite-type tricarboxylate transporter receptor subunit TctC
MKRRAFIQAPAAFIAGTALSSVALAQGGDFPSKPIRLVIPTSPGSMSDAVARLYGELMAKALKQTVMVENMPGAGTLMAMRHLARATPDGYTLSVSSNSVVTMPYVDKNAGYRPSDLTGVANLASAPMVLVVSGASPFKTLGDLVAAARKDPDAITYASVGIGTVTHVPVELFSQAARIKMTLVPYKGTPLALPDVVTQRVTLIMGTSSSVNELIKTGKLRALAVTSEARSPTFPNVPTFAELGYKAASYDLFLGLMAPAKTPPAVLKLLADAAAEAKKDPELRKQLAQLGQELPAQATPEQFNEFLRREEETMKKLVKDANIQVGAI